MDIDLKKIKKKYGEDFAHLCRDLFPTLLETEGLLYSLIESNFYPSKSLYFDIVDNNLESDFQSFINNLVITEEKVKIDTGKTPQELLDEVGYTLYECKTEQDIQSFKKYFAKGEELCTFRGGRLNSCHVFFAVKKNVDDIKRKNFANPQRQDEYGTSVISIQFTKNDQSTVSIKNRYNHKVTNPDATFSNNLDSIIYGLTMSFKNTYNLNFDDTNIQGFEIPKYVRASDGRLYKYNYEIDNIYYCPDNIIIDNFEVKKYEKERYIVLDYFILDIKLKRIEPYNESESDSFVDGLDNIDKVQIENEEDKKNIYLDIEGNTIVIVLDKENRIIGYRNDAITYIGDYFLYYNEVVEKLSLWNVKRVGRCFLFSNEWGLESIDLSSVEEVSDDFLYSNLSLSKIVMLYLEKVGNCFMASNKILNEIRFSGLKETGTNFLHDNLSLTCLNLPSLIRVGNGFISDNPLISEVSMPSLENVGEEFLSHNDRLKVLILPKLKKAGNQFLRYNTSLVRLELPELESIDEPYLEYNKSIYEVMVPKNMWNDSAFSSNFKSKQKKLGTMSTKQY